MEQEDGFSRDELNSCLKVLTYFQKHIDELQEPKYKELRSAGIIFVEGLDQSFFDKKSYSKYQRNKQRK